jgi:hypothetical protein
MSDNANQNSPLIVYAVIGLGVIVAFMCVAFVGMRLRG